MPGNPSRLASKFPHKRSICLVETQFPVHNQLISFVSRNATPSTGARPMKKPWIICALMGWGMFALAMFTPQSAPAQQSRTHKTSATTADTPSTTTNDGGNVAAAMSPCIGDVDGDAQVGINDLV